MPFSVIVRNGAKYQILNRSVTLNSLNQNLTEVVSATTNFHNSTIQDGCCCYVYMGNMNFPSAEGEYLMRAVWIGFAHLPLASSSSRPLLYNLSFSSPVVAGPHSFFFFSFSLSLLQ